MKWEELAEQYLERYEACKDYTKVSYGIDGELYLEHSNGDFYEVSEDAPSREYYETLPEAFRDQVSLEEYLVVISQDW